MDKLNNENKPLVDPSSKKWLLGATIVIFLFIGLIIFYSISAGSKYTDFAKCVTETKTKMYGAYWCQHCQEQKSLFGKSWKYIDYIECSLPNRGGQNEICNSAGIKSYPTWEFPDGKRIEGVVSLKQISEATGCQLENPS